MGKFPGSEWINAHWKLSIFVAGKLRNNKPETSRLRIAALNMTLAIVRESLAKSGLTEHASEHVRTGPSTLTG